MKIDRLMGIIAVLQQRKKVTAPYLAERFEVSRRTISRDIEDICKAGIPIVTEQGGGGGISVAEGYRLDTPITSDELQLILAGISSVNSISPKPTALAEKLGGKGSVSMDIDLASFYKDSLSEKIELINTAINQNRLISFLYYYNKGEVQKLLEPYKTVYKWSDWYVFGFCKKRQDFRMFKLRRLWELKILDETFTPRKISEKSFGESIECGYFVEALYDSCVKYKLVEQYGPSSFETEPDGRLYAKWGFVNAERALEWIMGFGGLAEVISPNELRRQIAAEAKNMLKKYEHDI